MSVDHSKSIVEFDHVSFSFTGKPADDVIHDISLRVHQGDYIGLIGPNGAGKTTLLKLALGLLQPREGSIRLFGEDAKKFTNRFRLSYVPQKTLAFTEQFPVTVEEVVLMGCFGKRGLFHFTTPEDRVSTNRALEQVDMLSFAHTLVNNLSGGQQQRVLIARALVTEPEVIFLDEPTVGVDQKASREFYDLLHKINATLGRTIVLVSHDIEMVTREVMHLAYINIALKYFGPPETWHEHTFV